MAGPYHVAAVDLGAASGRVILAAIQQKQIRIREIHRFPNRPVRVGERLYWNILGLFNQVLNGLEKAGQQERLASIGIDTWGVDFGLLDRDDRLIGNPFHYRDPQTNGVMDAVFDVIGKEALFMRTGIQMLQINSLYQLFAMKGSAALENARRFLTIPDLLNFWLTGVQANEYSNASTTQFLDPASKTHDLDLLAALGLPTDIFPQVVMPGTMLGGTTRAVSDAVGQDKIPVVAPACHDTGSAVAAVPLVSDRAAYISSGTWSLIGVEKAGPVINKKSMAHNFTNEGGVGGTIRLLKNVTGMWLAQECLRAWNRQGIQISWEEMTRLAEEAATFGPVIDPDHQNFLNPADMPDAIRGFCRDTNQPVPSEIGPLLRCVYESLALKYRWVLSSLEDILGHSLDVIHVIGGGARNRLLCQLTADATGKPVIAGPVEATAIGNTIVQAISLNLVDTLAEGRNWVRHSFPLETYTPVRMEEWDLRYEKMIEVLT